MDKRTEGISLQIEVERLVFRMLAYPALLTGMGAMWLLVNDETTLRLIGAGFGLITVVLVLLARRQMRVIRALIATIGK